MGTPPTIIDISGNLDDPRLSAYRTLRRPAEHLAGRIFVAEGENVVRRLLASSLPIHSLLVTPEWFERLGNEPRFHGGSLTVYRAPQKALESIVGFNLHQGIMAVAEMPPDPELAPTVESLGPAGVIVALDGLVSAENVGVIVRNCAGLGAGLILVGETTSSPWLRRAVRNSMGTVFTLPVIHCASLRDALKELQSRFKYLVAAADPKGTQSLYATDLYRKLCIVAGSEGDGLTPSVLELCDVTVSIPMAKETDSLNVANATAVFLAEAARQRAVRTGR